MKKLLKFFAIFFVGVLLFFLVTPLFIKKNYSVQKSILVNVSKNDVMDYMKLFSNFDNWSPWSKMDENMFTEISGIDGEIGAQYYWKGNDDVGEGKMKIKDLTDNEIFIQLTFIEPFESVSPTVYSFEQTGEGTTVTWKMEGEMSYPWNIFLLFMDMEEAIGKDFDNGLELLKSAIE